MKSNRIKKKTILERQAPEWPVSLLSKIQQQIKKSGLTIVVLDDDPTGTQTVYDISILTSWSTEILEKELQQKPDLFYILTNSRSLPANEARELNIEIGRNLVTASKKANRPFVVVSRSDSTLRGHYPEEVDALVSTFQHDVDGYLIIPYFLEGGRLTIDDIHWVEEKTKGKVKADEVTAISIDDIRNGGPDKVFDKLFQLENGVVCIINSITLRDMEVFVHALLTAEDNGKRFVYRTASSFVQIRAGLSTREMLQPKEICANQKVGGLFIVGSYVPKTTKQLEFLLENTSIFPIEIKVQELIANTNPEPEIQRITELAENKIKNGVDVVIYTSRQLVQGEDSYADLNIGNRISSILVKIMSRIRTRPRFLVAKGGITSSDIATKGLNIKRAMVMGQILPGVPVWKTGEESLFPGLMYILFPGNVGKEEALATVLEKLSFSGTK